MLRFTREPHIKLTSDNLTQMKDSQAKQDHKKGYGSVCTLNTLLTVPKTHCSNSSA